MEACLVESAPTKPTAQSSKCVTVMHVSCVTALRSHGTLLHAPGAAGLWLNARRLGAPLPFHADPAGPHRSSASCSSTAISCTENSSTAGERRTGARAHTHTHAQMEQDYLHNCPRARVSTHPQMHASTQCTFYGKASLAEKAREQMLGEHGAKLSTNTHAQVAVSDASARMLCGAFHRDRATR